MNLSREQYARLAKGSYGSQPIEGFDIDRELSNQNRTVYTKDGKAIISYRGTDVKNPWNRWKDLGTDALIALGLQDEGSRFKNAEKYAKDTIQKYGAGNVELTGHSLGGSQALYVSDKLGLPAKAFNPGVSPLTIEKKPGFGKELIGDVVNYVSPQPGTKTESKAKVYTTGVDPISGSILFDRKGYDVELVKPKSWNVHGITNFY